MMMMATTHNTKLLFYCFFQKIHDGGTGFCLGGAQRFAHWQTAKESFLVGNGSDVTYQWHFHDQPVAQKLETLPR